jgi:hypothetical protein
MVPMVVSNNIIFYIVDSTTMGTIHENIAGGAFTYLAPPVVSPMLNIQI